MAVKTFYLLPGAIAAGAKLHRDMQDGGGAPSALTSGTGWTVGKTATSTPYDLMIGGTKRAANTFGATAMPNVAPVDGTTGDSFRSPAPLTGTIANTNWVAAFPVISVSNAATGSARARLRVWKTASVTGDNTSSVLISDTATTSTHGCYRTIPCTGTLTYTIQARFKAGSKTTCALIINGATHFIQANFDLAGAAGAGSVVSNSTFGAGETFVGATITALANGWYLCTLTGNMNAAGETSFSAFMCTDIGFYAEATAGAKTIYATGLQAEQASSASAYEQTWGAAGTVNLADYSEGNFNANAATLSLDGTTDPFGYAVTELTSAAVTGTTISNLLTSAEQASTVTWTPGSTFTLAGEFLFFQTAWEILGASGSSTADMVLRRNSTAVITTPDISTGVTLTLTGQALAFAQGTFTPVVSKTLTGQALAWSQGSVLAAIARALLGLGLTFGQGTLTASISGGSVTIQLTGQTLAMGQGTVAPAITISLPGQALAGTQGILTSALSKALTGISLVASQGTVTPALSRTLTGQGLSMSQGNLAPAIARALAGQQLVASQGTLTAAVIGPFGAHRMFIVFG